MASSSVAAPLELWSRRCQEKMVSPDQWSSWSAMIKAQGQRIATLNGSFDLLHAGHLQIIFEASQVGDVLMVALNSDPSIRQYKHPDRPIIPLEYRLQMMAALAFVDYVTWFDETDPRRFLAAVQPHVHVNGAEYGADCLEADTVRAHGGRLHIVPLVLGLSTSGIIRKIHELGPSPCV